MAVISLHRICSGICDESGDTAKKTLATKMRYGNLAVKDLVLNVVPWLTEFVNTSRILPIGVNWYVDLPADYIYWVSVGAYNNGRICLLGENDGIVAIDAFNQNCSCEATQEMASILNGTCGCDYNYPFYNSYYGWSSPVLGEMYGARGGYNFGGYFKIDKQANRILLSTDLPASHIIISYKSDPTLNGINLVPSECELAIREFVHWRDNLNSRPSVAQMHREEYIVEYNKLKKMYSSLTDVEYRDIFLRATTSTVKR